MVEVAVFLVNVPIPEEDWPGKNVMDTKLIGRLPLEGGRQVAIIYRVCEMWKSAPSMRGEPQYFRGRSKADLLDANRMVAWGAEADGSIVFVESRVMVERNDAT
jgi:hypothetical protein